MGIKTYNRGVISIYYKGLPITSVYIRGQKVWPEELEPIIPIIEEVISCFAKGYWIDEYPWTDDLPWFKE